MASTFGLYRLAELAIRWNGHCEGVQGSMLVHIHLREAQCACGFTCCTKPCALGPAESPLCAQKAGAPHMRPFRPCVCMACHSALQEPLGECSTVECPNDYLMKDSMPVPPPNCHGKTCEACEPVAECTEVPAAYKILSIATSNR